MKNIIAISATSLLLLANASFADVTGHKEESMQGGYAETTATLYKNGLLVLETHAKSNTPHKGVTAGTFVVGVDAKGRALYISPYFDIPTACGTWDPSPGCSSNVRKNRQDNMSENFAAIIERVEVFVDSRKRDDWSIWQANVKKACELANDLPTPLKAECGK